MIHIYIYNMFMYIIYNIYTYRFAERYRADVCSRMLTYAHACSRMLTYAHVC